MDCHRQLRRGARHDHTAERGAVGERLGPRGDIAVSIADQAAGAVKDVFSQHVGNRRERALESQRPDGDCFGAELLFAVTAPAPAHF